MKIGCSFSGKFMIFANRKENYEFCNRLLHSEINIKQGMKTFWDQCIGGIWSLSFLLIELNFRKPQLTLNYNGICVFNYPSTASPLKVHSYKRLSYRVTAQVLSPKAQLHSHTCECIETWVIRMDILLLCIRLRLSERWSVTKYIYLSARFDFFKDNCTLLHNT